jgi:hypothetical protein
MLLCFVLLPAVGRAQVSRDAPIYRWTGSDFVQIAGSGTRISVAPDGSAWVVNAAGEIFHSNGDVFEPVPGSARDIAVGREGSVWVIGTDGGIYRWRRNQWESVEGSGVAIAVDRSGEPWVVNATGEIYRRGRRGFQKVQGTARDIGADNDVWIVGTDNAVRQMRRAGEWGDTRGSAVHISVSSRGPWVVNDANRIYRWENGSFTEVPGAATDVGVNARGDVWVIGVPGALVTQRPAERRARPRR